MMSKKVPELRFKGFTDEWEQRKLGEVGYFYYGKSAPKWSVTEDAETPCIRYGELYTKYGAKISNIYSHTNINPKNLKFSTGNEVLVPRVGENPLDFSLCSWLSIPNVAIGEMISVYNTNENPLFISYYFRGQMKYEFAKRVEGGNVSNLYYSYLEDIDLYIPKLEEQIAISKFFENLDNTIALYQRKLDLLKEQKKGFLQKMFPKNGAKVPELRFAGFADDWEERKLGDIVVKAVDNRGKTPPTSENDKYPLLEVASIGGYYPNYSKVTKFVNYNIFNSWFRSHLKKGDILFSTVGNTGLATLMDDNQDATIAQNIVGFRAKNSNVPEFLLQMFKLPSNLKKVKRIEMGAVQPSIKVSQLIKVQYLLPKCKHEQERIGSFLKKLDEIIELHQRKLDLLKEQKKGFLQKMFV
ncbi:restriction endonuclease subunit S [Streptococcus thermophilus]|uniref:restriction endonuclease subunit S n=1 Tax=Streptococcus thermophilus TaxID=1308 RepID=UPI0022FDF697|nr:restriction endonuclease subunit S [Streptococcus thermophilus]MDA5554901.1 restriction endonuclease subunit S [Streptococcus thermophilus]